MNRLDVTTPTGGYPIIIDDNLLVDAGALINQKLPTIKNAVVITNTTVGPLYAQRLVDSLLNSGMDASVIELPDGEQYKTLDTINKIYQGLLENGLDRAGLVIGLGGGVVGDMAGFAAATYLRGVRFVQVPTTLLAMVDSSVGGKTGVDLPQGKNLVGAFKQPEMVLMDPLVLNTLETSEFASGMAEVIKHALIGDRDLFEQLVKEKANDWSNLIARAVSVKKAVVESDPFEEGKRAILNLGHTFGHAFELVSGFTLNHGHAVGIGLIAAAKAATIMGLCKESLLEDVEKAVALQGLSICYTGHNEDTVIRAMGHDKKIKDRKIHFVMPWDVEDVKYNQELPEEVIAKAVAHVSKPRR